MPLLHRLAIFLGLWLLAGVTSASFARGMVDCGESEAIARFRLVCFAPLLSAFGIAFMVVQNHHDTWKLNVICWLAMACFLAHAMVILTRRDRHQFMVMVAVQVVMLGISVSSVLSLFHDLSSHGHG